MPIEDDINLLKNCVLELQRTNLMYQGFFCEISKRLDLIEKTLSDEDPAVDEIPVEQPAQPQTPMEKQEKPAVSIIYADETIEDHMFR